MLYDNLVLPLIRSTVGSAGCDFITPIDIELSLGENEIYSNWYKCKFTRFLCII